MEKNNYKIIKCDSSDLENILLPILIGRVFHVTSVQGYKGIRKEGKIRHNRNERFQFTFGQSKASYGRRRGRVCLFDLRNVTDEELEDALCKYYFPNPTFANDNPIFLFLGEEVYPKLIQWTDAEAEKAYSEMWVSYIECWHPGDIPFNKITDILEVRVKRDLNSIEELMRLVEKSSSQEPD